MSKLRCPGCGARIREDDVRCEDCGIYLTDDKKDELNDIVKHGKLDEKVNEFMDNLERRKNEEEFLNDVDTDSLEHRSSNNIDKLSLVAGFLKVVWALVGILLAIIAIVNNTAILVLYSILIFITIPFVALPITWMQLMLENIVEINKSLKK